MPVPVWEASTPEPTTFSAASSRWRPSSTGSSASGRARTMRTSWRAPASSVTFAPARLSSRSSAIACSATTRRVVALGPSAVVMASRPGRPFMRPTRTVSLSSPEASEDSSSGRPCSIAVWTASPSSMTALWVAWNSSKGAEPSRRRGRRRTGRVTTRSDELGDLGAVAVGGGVAAAADEDAAPAVERVLGDAGVHAPAEFAGERLGERLGGVGVLARPGVQRARVPALEQLRDRRRSGRTAARRSRSRVAPSAASARIASSENVGVSSQPPPGAGVRKTPTGRSTRSTLGSCASASASQVGEASCQQRRSWASKSSAWASAQRESCSRGAGVEPESPCDRALAVGGRDPDGGVVEIDRHPGVGAAQRVVELGCRRAHVRPVEAGFAVGLVLAGDSVGGSPAARAARG